MTENNQAAASEDDQDVGHVGVGAYVALIITILLSCVLRTASRVSLILMGEQFIGLEPNLPGVTSL